VVAEEKRQDVNCDEDQADHEQGQAHPNYPSLPRQEAHLTSIARDCGAIDQ
jgi:hypothetical protein